MGVDLYVLDFLLRCRTEALGKTLWLGRQQFLIDDQNIANEILRNHIPSAEFSEIASDTGYSEKLFQYLGSTSLSTMDISSYEGADIIHDLNLPVSMAQHNKYDCIFDGGTIEHIFNVPVAFANVNSMLRVGGVFLSVTPANNWLGHGFYQFSPELMWRVFTARAGYKIERMCLMDLSGLPTPQDLIDPETLGLRQEIGATPTATYLMVAARKAAIGSFLDCIQQSDYTSIWLRHKNRGRGPEHEPDKPLQRQRGVDPVKPDTQRVGKECTRGVIDSPIGNVGERCCSPPSSYQ